MWGFRGKWKQVSPALWRAFFAALGVGSDTFHFTDTGSCKSEGRIEDELSAHSYSGIDGEQ